MHRRKRSVIVFKSKALQKREEEKHAKEDEELFSCKDGEVTFSLHMLHNQHVEIRCHTPNRSEYHGVSSQIGCCYVLSLLSEQLRSSRESALRTLCASILPSIKDSSVPCPFWVATGYQPADEFSEQCLVA